MKHTFTDPDLAELDRIWPLGERISLPEQCNIVIAGAYHGRYVAYFLEKYPKAFIVAYEPQPSAFSILRGRFANDLRVHLNHAALGTAARIAGMGRAGTDGCSLLSRGGNLLLAVQMIDAVEALQFAPVIDLFVMNMEGYEWALLPYLLQEMMHHRMRTLAIQFHPEYVSAERTARVQSELKDYYDNTFNCPGWTYWERKHDANQPG